MPSRGRRPDWCILPRATTELHVEGSARRCCIVKRIVDARRNSGHGGAVGRHRQQRRAFDSGGIGRACRYRTRSNPHTHRRRQKARQRPRTGTWADLLRWRSAKRSHSAARGALRCKNRRTAKMSGYPPFAARRGPHERGTAVGLSSRPGGLTLLAFFSPTVCMYLAKELPPSVVDQWGNYCWKEIENRP
jgi:hypothetical protein